MHHPDVPQEKIRIYSCKGETKESKADGQNKVFVRARMYPGLPITRSLGDVLAHHIGVTSEPSVVINKLEGNEKFLTIATDGIWKHFGPTDIGEIVSETILDGYGATCELIARKVKLLCEESNKDMEDSTIIITSLIPEE